MTYERSTRFALSESLKFKAKRFSGCPHAAGFRSWANACGSGGSIGSIGECGPRSQPPWMALAITGKDKTAQDVRAVAARCKDAKAARRMLAIAMVLEGYDRKTTAETCGMPQNSIQSKTSGRISVPTSWPARSSRPTIKSSKPVVKLGTFWPEIPPQSGQSQHATMPNQSIVRAASVPHLTQDSH